MNASILPIVDVEADTHFRSVAKSLNLDPDDPWIGSYAEFVWRRGRRVFETLPGGVAGRPILEFGCNYGATSITLARLGASVVAVDVSETYIALARANAARYGVSGSIAFFHATDTTRLPFDDASFEVITCCSVLEYVPPEMLAAVQRELDRVLRPGGLVVVTGTSNRIWPREVHSRRWCANYIPRALDKWLWSPPRERGVNPWRIRYGFGSAYENLDLTDHGRAYLDAKEHGGDDRMKCGMLRFANRVLSSVRMTVGLATPSISVRLRKPTSDLPSPREAPSKRMTRTQEITPFRWTRVDRFRHG
ncbi:MAG: class I SAM-dependent methyltransferase [Vicinamibacterales bacterium]